MARKDRRAHLQEFKPHQIKARTKARDTRDRLREAHLINVTLHFHEDHGVKLDQIREGYSYARTRECRLTMHHKVAAYQLNLS